MNRYRTIRRINPGFRPPRLAELMVCLCLCLAAKAGIAQSSAEPSPLQLNALLLKNDRTLLGNVERRGDVFLVSIAEQSRITLPKAQVAYVGRDLQDLYDYKVRSVKTWEVGDHFQLTRWCLTNGLLNEAIYHYDEVAKRAAGHPRVQQLAIEIKHKLLEVPEFRQFVGLPVEEATSRVLKSAGQGLSASAGYATGGATSSVMQASLTRNIVQHPQVVQQFSERVQPILINRCSQSACHGGHSGNSLRLIEPYAGSAAESNSDNLTSVLQHFSEDPQQLSPLLDFATRAHGLQRKPAISLTESALVSEIRNWIRFAQDPVISAEGSATQNGPALHRPGSAQAASGELMPVQPGASGLRQVPKKPGFVPQVAGFPPGDAPPTMEELDSLELQINQIDPVSNDPFDPAAFNRRAQSSEGNPISQP